MFYFHSTRRKFRERGILIVIPIDFRIIGIISMFGLDEKKENKRKKNREADFFFFFSKENDEK